MFQPKHPCVYVISNYTRTTFYIGVTSDLYVRIQYHKRYSRRSFSWRYNLRYLVYVEEFPSMGEAIRRESQLKDWHRQWKINLIQSQNPIMRDLAPSLFPFVP